MDENVKWLNDHGFIESNGVYELQAIPGVLFRVRWDGIQWQCQAIIKDMFPFIECHGNTSKKAVAKEAYNVSTSCLAQKSVVNRFLDKNLKQRSELNEEIKRQEKDIREYDNIVTVLKSFLEEGVFLPNRG